MDWNSIFTQVILSICGVIVTGLGAFITYLINKHIKDEELKDIINSLTEIVKNSVLETYQTYVEELKDKDLFDKEAQNKALERCLNLIKANMPSKVETWLKSNYTNAEAYLKSLIEAQIGLLKNGGKK